MQLAEEVALKLIPKIGCARGARVSNAFCHPNSNETDRNFVNVGGGPVEAPWERVGRHAPQQRYGDLARRVWRGRARGGGLRRTGAERHCRRAEEGEGRREGGAGGGERG